MRLNDEDKFEVAWRSTTSAQNTSLTYTLEEVLMIDSISGSFRPPPPNANSSNTLDDEQKTLIEETLSNYDPSALSQEDASNIVEIFGEAGITPGIQFADMLAASGFDAREIGSMANEGETGPSGQRPPPPPNSSSDNSELDLSSVIDYLDQLTSAQDSSSATSTSVAGQLAAQFGLSEGQSLINVMA